MLRFERDDWVQGTYRYVLFDENQRYIGNLNLEKGIFTPIAGEYKIYELREIADFCDKQSTSSGRGWGERADAATNGWLETHPWKVYRGWEGRAQQSYLRRSAVPSRVRHRHREAGRHAARKARNGAEAMTDFTGFFALVGFALCVPCWLLGLCIVLRWGTTGIAAIWKRRHDIDREVADAMRHGG
jgi:hypothetical protein